MSVETELTDQPLKRRRALARNKQGVVMLKGEWSFSSIDQLLINELVFYLQNVKVKCLPKYNKYENNVLEKYVITSVLPNKRKLNKKKNNDLLTILFTKICKIILVKLNVPKVKIQNSINEYKKILSYISKSSKKPIQK